MANELDTSWFNLKNYEALKTMSWDDWVKEISIRYEYYNIIHSPLSPDRVNSSKFLEAMRSRRLSSITARIKQGIVINNKNDNANLYYKDNAILNNAPFSTVSVNSVCSYDLAKLVVGSDLPQVCWDAYEYMTHTFPAEYEDDNSSTPDENLLELAYAPLDKIIRKQLDISHPLAYLQINLYATDEQIKNDFSHWLTHYRKTVNYQTAKKLFNQNNFNRWIEFGIIPYLDLTLIAKNEDKKIIQHKLAKLIFPDEYDVDIVERLRKVTKPEAKKLIKNKVHAALSAQLASKNKSGMKNA